ncbi:hypothetical protein MKZ38_006579 [Zalerion maritima]|uniref:Uncharacterized protein n=1 Tax=Zalerion maritima TaxID=339359 RepID=A0AAD5RIW0_9PEZI|nr:hypothetical protein MKZ38_006579 [Zalerion maritima]
MIFLSDKMISLNGCIEYPNIASTSYLEMNLGIPIPEMFLLVSVSHHGLRGNWLRPLGAVRYGLYIWTRTGPSAGSWHTCTKGEGWMPGTVEFPRAPALTRTPSRDFFLLAGQTSVEQYKTRNPSLKNLKKDEGLFVIRRIKTRRRRGEPDPGVLLNGQPVEEKKVLREFERYSSEVVEGQDGPRREI